MIYNIRVVGVTAENRQADLLVHYGYPKNHKLKFRLVQEPENKYDKNAIAVYSEDLNSKVGYVPKNETQIFNEKLNAGTKFDIEGFVVGGGEFNIGLVLKCTAENDNEKMNVVEV